MQTVEIKKENAISAFKNADDKGKALLTALLGKEIFAMKPTDRIKTLEDACAVLNINPSTFTGIALVGELLKDADSIIAYCKLIIIVRALNLNEDGSVWEPDWSNHKQYKWYVWFEHKSGSGLSFDGAGYWNSVTIVGSRLCFKSRELAEYAGKQFEQLYRDFFTIQSDKIKSTTQTHCGFL